MSVDREASALTKQMDPQGRSVGSISRVLPPGRGRGKGGRVTRSRRELERRTGTEWERRAHNQNAAGRGQRPPFPRPRPGGSATPRALERAGARA